ncbi:efflux transporter outer membrane subunit [Steroidobacter sp.]|uniref:efflux transporter outer membrane subunit n=1 Tax=Steroidobacter sp. TaxID=1978227 RepID=UPI001A48EB9C|nr:TolC family protein [Steroidobacter sp.]MBL8267734.1 TolC family protein [Steroidobacter sp.]
MSYRLRIAVALTIAALSGCSSTPMSPAAQPSVAAEYGRGDSEKNAPSEPVKLSAEDSTVAAAGPWWQQFGDERLNRLVEKMLAANTDIATAGLALERAKLVAGLAFDDLLPQLDASVSGSYSKSLRGPANSSKSYSAGVGVGYEVDLWRRLRNQHDIARWEAQATAEDLESTRLALIGETCDLYWQLAFLNQRIVASESSIERLRTTQRLVQVQFNAGDVSRLEAREAEQNYQSELAAHSQLLQSRVEVRNALTVLLDGTPWPQADEPGQLAAFEMPTVREGLPAELLGRRPDLRAAELRLRGVLTSVGVTRASYYPAVTLTGGVSSGSVSLSDVLSNPVATLGAGIALPFLQWNQQRLNVAIAKQDYAIAVNGFRDALFRAFADVDNALSALTALETQLQATQRSYDEAVEVERLYSVRYRVGATPLRSWLEAQETRRSAEVSLAQARLRRLQNLSLLYRALGGVA